MTNTYIAYTRVSTARQETEGVSLEEQCRAIKRWQTLHQTTVVAWYTETCTAGKRGRPVFKQLITKLRGAKGSVGLVIHKIDRGARNLRDWADIGELLDLGIDVRFAQEDFDLHTRGGRLAADIQAVVAADFIRNLREEVKKGIAGRLHQGIYPFKAPLGYLDRGRGKAKAPDPTTAPFIVYAFKRYAAGTCSLSALANDLAVRGLTRPDAKPLRAAHLSRILRNPFYSGTLCVKGQTFPGLHQPLVTPELYGTVGKILSERRPRKRYKHSFQYRKSLTCTTCQNFLVGELQKGNVYYRCKKCPGVCVREDRVLLPDHRFLMIPQPPVPEYPTMEPWEKFDYPRGIDQTVSAMHNQWLN